MHTVYPEGQQGASGREAVTLSSQVSSVTSVMVYMYLLQCAQFSVAAAVYGSWCNDEGTAVK
jgi:hypothetical protein